MHEIDKNSTLHTPHNITNKKIDILFLSPNKAHLTEHFC